MGMNLFDGSDPDIDDLSKIEIDTEFASRYEHNKKREDLQRYEELKKMGLVSDQSKNEKSDSEASDDEDNDDNVLALSKEKDLEFFNGLLMVRKQLPILENKELELFKTEPEDVGEDSGLDKKMEKVQKKMYLKDVIAKHLIEEGPEFVDKDEDGDTSNNKILSYNEEQEEIRKAFLNAVEANVGEDDGGDLFQVKEKARLDEDGELQEKLDEYFGGDTGDFDENAMFLKDYFMKKMWVDDGGGVKRVDNNGDEEMNMLSDDEKEIERQEEYEYRFQENAGDLVPGHSRIVEGSVRKKMKARMEQRKRKEERVEIARLEREGELRHLKNLKKKEMNEKVKRIMETAGISEEEAVSLSSKQLEEEFDPEEYDKMMKTTFGKEYYDAEDADPDFGSDGNEDDGNIEKPDFEKEDELLGLPKGWDHAEDDGFVAARERSLKHKMENDSDNEEETEVAEEGKRKRKRKKVALLEKAKQAMMEEYYNLDYEDVIGDLKTRFKYAKTKPNRYGLRTDEILVMDDMELSQYVSMKKLAPYREEEWKLPNSKRYQLKMRTRELLRGEIPNDHTSGKKKLRGDANKSTPSATVNDEKEKLQLEDSKCDTIKLSKKARRKQRQGQFKPLRLMLYGKMDPKPKKKQKH